MDDVLGEVKRTIEKDDHVLAYLRTRGRDKASGKPVELRFTAIYTFGDGKCVKL